MKGKKKIKQTTITKTKQIFKKSQEIPEGKR